MNNRDTLRSKIKWKRVRTNGFNNFPVPPDVSIHGVAVTPARKYINAFARKTSCKPILSSISQENKNLRSLCKHNRQYYLNGNYYFSTYRYSNTKFISLSTIYMILLQQKQNPFIKLRKKR